jgi:dipeptidyl-peptidase-4
MKNKLALAIATVTSLMTAPASPAAPPPTTLTLERLFQSPGLAGPAPRLLKLSPDGTLATLLKNRADDRDRYDLWAIDTTTGTARMLVDSEKVGSGAALSEEEKMRRERLRIGGLKGITAYDWAPDGKSLLVPLDGDLYLAALDGTVRRLTNTPETEIEAKVSESGRYVSFVRNQNLYVIDLTTGQEHALTQDGKGALSWGTAEFVAQEELNRFAGSWWGPGDARVAVQRTDESGVKVVHRASIGADGTKVFDQRYPAAGTPNAVVQLWLMNADGSARVQADLGRDPNIYLARVNWARDGKALYVQRLSRDQKKLDMLKVDAATGTSTVLFSETSKAWINLNDDFRVLADGSLIWSSERTGTKHLYRWVAGKWIALTHGAWTLETDGQSFNAGLIGVDQANHRLFFTANKDDVLESQVYAIDYLKPGEPRRLTERGYWNDAQMDRTGQRLIVRRSSPSQPPQYYMADAAGRRLTWISENALVEGHPYAPYLASHRETVFGTIKAADGSILHWKMIKPAMEPGKKYPVFMEHYGGPHSQTVQRAWANPMGQYLASQGWIFFEIDNRGSANRGRAFEDQIYHAMGTVEVEDQVAAAKWLKTMDYVDPAKVVTYGWSYGGYMTLKMLEAAPGVFAAGIAGAPVTQWELYDTAYTERYLGDPTKLPKVYAVSNALDDAVKIKDPLLVIHGMADDNVVFENSTMLFARMQDAKVPFEMMVYPGKTHSPSGEGTQIHVWETILRFLHRNVDVAAH